jgi:hypothetical protein
MIGRDGLAGLAVCAASLVLFWLTLGLQTNPLVPIGPGFYPRIVLGATGALGLALVIADFLAPRTPRPALRLNYPLVGLCFAVFAAYVLALPYLGFRIATFAFVAALNAVLEPPRRPVQWLRVAAIALATSIVTWLAFEHYLSVLMPRGRWTEL